MAKKSFSESERIHNQLNNIANQIYLFEYEIDLYELGFSQIIKTFDDEVRHRIDIHILEEEFISCFLSLYKQSLSENYFWQYCPFKVYESHFENKISEYLNENPDALISDFTRIEINDIENNYQEEKNQESINPNTGDIESINIQREGFLYYFDDKIEYRCILIIKNFDNLELFEKLKQNKNRKKDFLFEQSKPTAKNEKTNSAKEFHTSNDFSEIFTEGGYEVFLYLDENYTRDNNFRPTKYSNIYRVMQEKFIIGTQDQFKDFLKENYDVLPSKLLNNEYKESYKFKKKIKPYLLKLMDNFKDEN
jgi:hypothetical protein